MPKEAKMKSRITLSLPHRAVTFAGLLALAGLALANAAHAQTVGAERALLNKTDAPFDVSETKAPPVVDGARALLGQPGGSERSPGLPPAGSSRLTLGGAYRIDGARALLGGSFGHQTTHANSALRN
jgi:hypothetical protein